VPSGDSKGTQILDNELFDFNLEVEPILEVLVGKAIDQSLVEVLEEQGNSSLLFTFFISCCCCVGEFCLDGGVWGVGSFGFRCANNIIISAF
jgi:hypothetical protein